jgi:hypothetical protein
MYRFPLLTDKCNHVALLGFYADGSETLEQPVDTLTHYCARLLVAQPADFLFQALLEFHARKAALAGMQVVPHGCVLVIAKFMVDELENFLQRLFTIDLLLAHDLPPLYW